MKYTDKQLLDRIEDLDTFDNWPNNGILDIWVRSEKDEFNKFDDKVYTFDCKSEPQFINVNTGTSNAGAVGLKHFAKYNALGCAILKADHIQYNSHIYGKHKGVYPAYIENPNNPFPYFRDSDKDEYAEEIGKIYTNNIGANCHHAGIFSTRIDGWSVACLVRNILRQWDDWLAFMNKRQFLSTAILNEF